MVRKQSAELKALLALPEEVRAIGPYWLRKQLGEGGASAPVWLADERYGSIKLRDVALKIFSVPKGNSNPVLRNRILEEARTLCLVQHPNVVAFYSVVVDDEHSLVALAMEFVAGRSLATRLHSHSAVMSLRETLAVGIAVSSALSAVHQAGLVHRDVKPDNIIEAPGGYKLIDFGIAASEGRPAGVRAKKVRKVVLDDVPIELGTRSIRMSQLVDHLPADIALELQNAIDVDGGESKGEGIYPSGTVGYMDPICVSSPLTPATAQSDLYALGATLFECITGKLPAAALTGSASRGFRGDILDGRQSAPPIASLCPELPTKLANLIDSLLSVDRELRPSSAESVTQLLETLRSEIAGRQRFLPPEELGPFRGLARFEAADRDIFFGRAADVASVIDMFRSRGLVALVGGSGVGKSSLARAGVLPALEDGVLSSAATMGGSQTPWQIITITPGIDATTAATQAISSVCGAIEDESNLQNRLDPIVWANRLANYAASLFSKNSGVVLFVDQLEELVTVSREKTRPFLVNLLVLLTQQPLPGLRVLVTVRQDLFEQFISYSQLGKVLLRGTHVVLPLNDTAWGDVLDQSLGAYGYSFENTQLRNVILEQLHGTISAMPLVQFALTQLWSKRDPSTKKLTAQGLAEIGGISGALEKHAESTLARHSKDNPDFVNIARHVLLALTTAQGTRATRSLDELIAPPADSRTRAVIERLERSRLICCEEKGYTLTHETLLSQWGTLRTWVLSAQDDRELQEEMERDAKRWILSAQDNTLLWRGNLLLQGLDLMKRQTLPLSADAHLFLRASKRLERRARWIVGGIALTVMFGLVAEGGMYLKDRIQYEKELRTALERAEQSERQAKQNADEAQKSAYEAEISKRAAQQAEQTAANQREIFRKDLESLQAKIQGASVEQLRKLQEDVQKKKSSTAPTVPSPEPSRQVPISTPNPTLRAEQRNGEIPE